MRDVLSLSVTLRAMYIRFNGHLETQSFKRSSVSQNITQVRCLSIDGGTSMRLRGDKETGYEEGLFIVSMHGTSRIEAVKLDG